MRRLLAHVCLSVLAIAGWAPQAAAQNLVITNARILDGVGGVIERGSIVVRDGKIVSVSVGTSAAPGARVVDVKGRTVMPGFIEAHRHVIQGDGAQWLKEQAIPRMQEFLDAGFTTVLSAGDSLEHILELRQRLQQGTIRGPRLIVSGRVPLAGGGAGGGRAAGGAGRAAGDGGRGRAAGDGARGRAAGGGRGQNVDPARSDRSRAPRPEAAPAIPVAETRATVEMLAEAGVDALKTAIIVTPGGPEKETLKLVVSEGKRHNIPTITHAVTVQDTVAAVEAGVATLVHTPHIGRLDESPDTVRLIAKAGIPMMSTLGIFIPYFDQDNVAVFRDRGPFPWETLSSGGQGPVNARLLWEAGITYGYGTDSSWLPRESLAHELRSLHLMFSPRDIVSILTRNAAATVHRANQIGTLEAGKLADIVVLNGDPLASVTNLLNVAMVFKGGEIVVDKR
jgi:imidazolonepropionase-like amidohydrolase